MEKQTKKKNAYIPQRRYAKRHKDKINKYHSAILKDRYDNDVSCRVKYNLLARHSGFLRGNNHAFNLVVGMSLEQYKEYIKSLLPKHLNFDDYGKTWQLRRKKSIKEYDDCHVEDYMHYSNAYVYEVNKDAHLF